MNDEPSSPPVLRLPSKQQEVRRRHNICTISPLILFGQCCVVSWKFILMTAQKFLEVPGNVWATSLCDLFVKRLERDTAMSVVFGHSFNCVEINPCPQRIYFYVAKEFQRIIFWLKYSNIWNFTACMVNVIFLDNSKSIFHFRNIKSNLEPFP